MNAMQEFLGAAMMFVSQQTGLSVPDALPTVEILPHCEVQKAFDRPCNYGVQGYYEDGSNHIVMSDRYKEKKTLFQAILVHELTHYMQDHAGLTKTLSNCRLEVQAYLVDEKYLEHRGMKDSSFYKMSAFKRLSYGDCSSGFASIKGQPR